MYQSLQTLTYIRKANGDLQLLTGALQPISIVEEKVKKRAGNFATAVSNLSLYGVSISKTAADLQRVCASRYAVLSVLVIAQHVCITASCFILQLNCH